MTQRCSCDRIRQCSDAMPPGVKCAWSTSLSGEQGTSSPRPPEVQTGFGREMPSPASQCLRPHCFQRAQLRSVPCPLILFLGRRYDGAESIETPLVQARPCSSYSSGSLSQRKIYVNRHVDTCLNVASARARAERGEERGIRERRAWKSGHWYAVSDFAVSRVG